VLGGGIKTRLERIININGDMESWMQEAVVKFITINYNSCIILYGTKDRLL